MPLDTTRLLSGRKHSSDDLSDHAIGEAKLRARYDAAEDSKHTERHWENADHLSPNAANSYAVRRKLRSRSRYEYANNSYLQGMAQTLANEVIGTGPRLQLLTSDDNANRFVERSWREWSVATGFAETLRTLRTNRLIDGAGLAVKVTDMSVRHPVKMRLREYEIDRLHTPDLWTPTPDRIDGIRFDRAGIPVLYDILRNHPGGDVINGLPSEYDSIPARHVIHWFKSLRAEQSHGIPEITPALPLFAQLRRFTLAVLAAAETAAELAAVMRTNVSDLTAQKIKPMQYLPLEMRQMLTLPEGWTIEQFEAKQPAATYEMFKRELLNEIARVMGMPYNVAAGNSSKYNYASGRLDHQTWFKVVDLDRHDCEVAVLCSIIMDWLNELDRTGQLPDVPVRAVAVPCEGFLVASDFLEERQQLPIAQWLRGDAVTSPTLPQLVRAHRTLTAAGFGDVAHSAITLPIAWHWDGREHVDPQKEANAQATRLQNRTTTLATEFARQGRDWQEELRQMARERQLMDQLGLTPDAAADTAGSGGTRSQNEDDDMSAAFEDADSDTQDEVRHLLNL